MSRAWLPNARATPPTACAATIHTPVIRLASQPNRIRIGSAVFGGADLVWPRPRPLLDGRRFFALPDLPGPFRPGFGLRRVVRLELVRAGIAFSLRGRPPLLEEP